MARSLNKVGDVFEVPLSAGQKGYLQFICKDDTQLASEIVRVFEGADPEKHVVDIDDIVARPVHFHSHVFLKACVKFGAWKKIGNHPPVALELPLFRGTDDVHVQIGNAKSRNWYVWEANKPTKYVGELRGQHQFAEIGDVIPFQEIAERMETGHYSFAYPSF